MKAHDTIGHLLRKATRANLSAQLLLEAGDVDGACSRAYYAMFDAARAALLMADEAASAGSYKTHAGVLGRFSEQLVKTGRVPVELGRMLRRAETARVLADYREASVEESDAARIVEEARDFVMKIKALDAT